MRAKIIVQKYDGDGDYNNITTDTPPIAGAKSISYTEEDTFKRSTYISKNVKAVLDEHGMPVIAYDEVVHFYQDFFNEKKWKSVGTDHYYDEAKTTWHRMIEQNDWFIDIETLDEYRMIVHMLADGTIHDIEELGEELYQITIRI